MDPLTTVRRRLVVQRLSADPLGSPAAVVRWLGTLQAQEYAEAQWSIARRMGEQAEVTDDLVEAAFASGAIIRTHLLRPTWHAVAADDLRWMLALTAPRVHAVNKYWYKKLGLDDDVLTRALSVVDATLGDGAPRTRPELAAALAAAGLVADGHRLSYLMMYAELEGVICSGPRRGKQQTYMSLDARVGPSAPLDREQALAELTSRYFRSRGPATVKDFTTWSGLTVADATVGLGLVGDELIAETDGDGTTFWSAPDAPPPASATGAHLIPTYDELTLAYRTHRIVLPTPPPPAGLLERPILMDGVTIGSWRRTLTARTVTVAATLFTAVDGDALEAEIARFGRFLGRTASLSAQSAR